MTMSMLSAARCSFLLAALAAHPGFTLMSGLQSLLTSAGQYDHSLLIHAKVVLYIKPAQG